MLIKSMNKKENLKRIIKIQSFTRGVQQRKRYKRLLVIARKVVNLAGVLTKVNNQFCKGLLFYRYETRYEALIRRLRLERVELCA